jgi:hypothetical protein
MKNNKIVEDWVAKYSNNPEVDKILDERVKYMENKQQTAVTWLIAELISNKLMALRYDSDNTFGEIIEKAKQMEKQQIINTYIDGDYQAFESEAEQYYNKKYGSSTPELRHKDGTPMRKYNSLKLKAIEMENKQLTAVEWLTEKFTECGFTFSGNIFEEAKKMEEEQMENLRPQITSNCVIKEISDEEIEKEAEHYAHNYFNMHETNNYKALKQGFLACAQWYREQLKNIDKKL